MHRLKIELAFAVPAIVNLSESYALAFQETGEWPEPGTVYDDSALPFLESTQEESVRIDIHGTMIPNRRIEFGLHPDGTIRASVVSLSLEEG